METMTVREAARFLGVGERWLRQQAQERKIAHYRIAHKVRFRLCDLETYLEHHYVTGGQQ